MGSPNKAVHSTSDSTILDAPRFIIFTNTLFIWLLEIIFKPYATI